MSQTISMVQNDTAPLVTFNVKRSGASVDLTGSTVNFKIKNPSGVRTNLGTSTCTITDAPNGVCTYSWGATDIPVVGAYTADLEITYSGGKVETAPKAYKINVRAEND